MLENRSSQVSASARRDCGPARAPPELSEGSIGNSANYVRRFRVQNQQRFSTGRSALGRRFVSCPTGKYCAHVVNVQHVRRCGQAALAGFVAVAGVAGPATRTAGDLIFVKFVVGRCRGFERKGFVCDWHAHRFAPDRAR